jgi:hypothetical protein
MIVEIERQHFTNEYDTVPLKRQLWSVYVELPLGQINHSVVRLQEYKEQHRESKRHKWKNDEQNTCYSRVDNREYWKGYGRSAETVPWDSAVLNEVAQKVFDAIKNAKVII